MYFAGTTANPNNFWIAWQARQGIWKSEQEQRTFRYLIHDQDTKFNRSFDNVFRSARMDIVRTPFCVPQANPSAVDQEFIGQDEDFIQGVKETWAQPREMKELAQSL